MVDLFELLLHFISNLGFPASVKSPGFPRNVKIIDDVSYGSLISFSCSSNNFLKIVYVCLYLCGDVLVADELLRVAHEYVHSILEKLQSVERSVKYMFKYMVMNLCFRKRKPLPSL